jgi:uncharacterized protein (TIGR01440 family)
MSVENHIADQVTVSLEEIAAQAKQAVQELLAVAKLEKGDLFVVGCSSSEVQHKKIGSWSSEEIGKTLFDAIYGELQAHGIRLATQCCEHLNRALIMEEETAKAFGYPMVNVVPQLKAGGSFSTAAYAAFEKPVAVEHISAQAGMDIGDTLIGMHLQDVAVPVRISIQSIGNAHLVCARTRRKCIGGIRAHYNDAWM